MSTHPKNDLFAALKGEWLTNADPAEITALPDGKGYSVRGNPYPAALLGRPAIPPFNRNARFTVEDLERLGSIGLYEPFSFAALVEGGKKIQNQLDALPWRDPLYVSAGDAARNYFKEILGSSGDKKSLSIEGNQPMMELVEDAQGTGLKISGADNIVPGWRFVGNVFDFGALRDDQSGYVYNGVLYPGSTLGPACVLKGNTWVASDSNSLVARGLYIPTDKRVEIDFRPT